MATTNELLEEMEAEMLTGENDTFVVDNNLRTVSIPESMSVLGVEHDDDVHRLYFQIPKMYGDTDLSDFDIRINYMNAAGEGDVYAVTDKEVSGDNITFSWLVGRHAFAQRGDVIFIVCLKQTDDEGNVIKEFNTTVTTLPPVLEGLETSELVIQENPDIIEQILARLDDLEENGGGGGGTPGKDGVGIDRIEKTSTQGLVDTYTIYLTDDRTYTFTVTNGPQGPAGETGPQGPQGPKGDTGATPNIQIGTVQTLEPGQDATASITGTTENPLLNLGIPKGENGDEETGATRIATFVNDAGREKVQSMVSFVDDDCRSDVYTVLFPLIKTLDIPYTLACPTGNIGDSQYITEAQLKEMYNYGLSIACHTVNQTNMDTVDRDQLRLILEQSLEDLAGWGINDVRTYAYCQGKYTVDNIQVVKEFFDAGFLTDKGINQIPYESYYLRRVGLFPSTGSFTLAQAKEYVDELAGSGGWLIFMTHCYTDTFSSSELSELVNYVKGKSIEIVDVNEALDRTGNVIEVGHYKKNDLDSGHYFVVDSLGRMHTDSVTGDSGETIELIDLVLNEGHQIGKKTSSTNKGKDIAMSSGNTTHVVSQPVDVTDCDSVIVTGWAYSGYGIYSFLDSSGECVSALWSTHSLAEGADSVENEQVSVPEGASTVIIAGHKDYIMPALKKVKTSGNNSGSGEQYVLPIMSDTQLGGGKAITKTSEDVPVAVDPETGQLFVPTYPENTSSSATPRQEMQNTNTNVTLEPNKLYVFPEMASLTVTLGTPSDTNVANEYHFFFTSGATATTLILNDVLSDAYSIEANMKYEVSILENVAYIKGVATGEV